MTQLRGFLGLAQYYRQYVKEYADVAGPIYDMLKDDAVKPSTSLGVWASSFSATLEPGN